MVDVLKEDSKAHFSRWPIPKSTEVISWDPNSNTVVIESEYLQLEPLGLLFILWFAVVMLFQLIGMVLHRIMTLGHIVSTTTIGVSKVLFVTII